jgi:ABC-2 type transport system ATP-binding protein
MNKTNQHNTIGNSDNSANLLEVRDLCKRYGDFALEGLTFNLPGGQIMGFIGPNGSGKTTAIKLILGVINQDGGSARTPGNQQIGVVMDTPLYAGDWKIADVETALAPFYQHWDAAKFAGCLEQFGLDRKKKVRELSRGLKVKLQMAAALSHNARLLILDEPTSGLDPVARDEICDLLRGFVTDESKSVLFSTHITADLEKTADAITFILNGRLMFTGPKDALLEKYRRVTGGPGELAAAHKKLILGLREYSTGFEGMTETALAGQLPPGLLTENISLDEIIIFMNKEVKFHE